LLITQFTLPLSPPQPERITGSQYKVTSDVWSLGLTIVEIAMNEFPFAANLQPIELLMTIRSSDCSGLLRDIPEAGVKWTQAMKDFVGLWWVICLASHPKLPFEVTLNHALSFPAC
jgi:mitogen-activated protein kinase kinase